MSDIRGTELCSDLYDILESCTNDELAPIVDILVKTPISVLKINRAFERHHPDHVRYADQVGDEIYRLSLMALGRSDGKRPSYEDMVTGLCKQIGIPAALNDINGYEVILLNTFSKQHLSSLPSTDRQRLVDEASVAASTAATGRLSSDAWPPFAWVFLQVAYLRRKLAEEGRMYVDSRETTKAGVNDLPALVDDGADALVVQTEDGHSILSLATLPDAGTRGWCGPENSRKAMNALTPILKAIQPYLSAEQMLKGGDYVRVTLPPGGALSFSEKLGHFVGVAKGHKGLVRLDPISAVSLVSPAVLLTLASAMAEQKKLEDIEKSLDEIKSSLKDVSKFQQNERRSVLTGSIRYFRQVAASVLTGELVSEVLHEIERHEVELVRVQEHLIEDIRAQIATLHAIKKDGWGSGKYVKAIQEAQAILDRMYDEALLCIRARACGYQLLCAYPGREAGKRARLEDISRALGIFSPTGETTISMDQVLREKIQGSSYEAKALLLTKENALFDTIMVESAAILKGLMDAGRDPSERIAPISIDVKMQDGLAIAVRTA
ncbi:hypothetical protein [Acidisphaera sp. S103]|uniref:hypothetical protein n=1 Tax=Acidisphaera sp. S103 TaxID=1747223 RepID=UPI00131E0DC6|nr:hypothetical protein [Acidisphaera sp. S103]